MISVYAPFDTPRLRYVLHWILVERLGLEYSLTHDTGGKVQLSYGAENPTAISFPETGSLRPNASLDALLSPLSLGAEGVRPESLNFDVFSAVFFLLSRAEEYGSFEADKHGRYPAKYSMLFRKGWLKIPVVDIWVEQLQKELNNRFGLTIPKPTFSFQPTYDIDIAYSYLHKGFRRTAGGLLRDLKEGNFRELNNRLQVFSGKNPDPYDSFRWLRSLHAQYGLAPVYFMLAAQETGPFDKNISPAHPAMRTLAQSFALEGTVGIHPSYTTSELPEKIALEKTWLQSAVGKEITHSRQHYIRLRFPQTYRQLLDADIHHDYSMGYPDALGFRAGTSHSFLWYDLEKEEQTNLRVYPFCFMDTTARDYLGLSATAAFEELEHLRKILNETGGKMTTVVHNFSLGTAADWPGWRDGYLDFVKSVV